MSVVALAIDALLPALRLLGLVLVLLKLWIINCSFDDLLVLIWPFNFGPLSDSVGRKPVVYMGFALFIPLVSFPFV
jgi:DHA1 family bicyclomycin/chloramphenicol resistance-like MFS transporter